MPHAAHFLERLDRVPRSLTDYALDLYRDDERVRWILHYAHLPKEVERVAFALDVGGDGPYIVVTRQGHFVTALGAGMKPSHLHVLTRSQVDTFSERVKDARSRHELAKEIVADGKKPEDMLGLLSKRPWGLSREEITAIAGWVPLMHLQFFTQIYEAADLPPRMRETYFTIRKRHVRRSPQTRDALANLWGVYYGIGARYVLGLMGDLAWVPTFAEKWNEDYGPTWLASDSLVASLAIRGAWAAGRLGKPLLPAYKRALVSQRLPTTVFDAILALTTIGLRHAGARDDARRILASATEHAVDGTWTRQIMTFVDLAFDDPDAALDPVVTYGRKMVLYARQKLSPTSAYRFEREEDVPRELALSAAASQTFHAYNPFVIQILPWVAKLTDPEELYLPEDLERALRPEPTPELVAEVIERHKEGGEAKPSQREEPKLGRNDPCACGSGKKYKKCCGA